MPRSVPPHIEKILPAFHNLICLNVCCIPLLVMRTWQWLIGRSMGWALLLLRLRFDFGVLVSRNFVSHYAQDFRQKRSILGTSVTGSGFIMGTHADSWCLSSLHQHRLLLRTMDCCKKNEMQQVDNISILIIRFSLKAIRVVLSVFVSPFSD